MFMDKKNRDNLNKDGDVFRRSLVLRLQAQVLCVLLYLKTTTLGGVKKSSL